MSCSRGGMVFFPKYNPRALGGVQWGTAHPADAWFRCSQLKDRLGFGDGEARIRALHPCGSSSSPAASRAARAGPPCHRRGVFPPENQRTSSFSSPGLISIRNSLGHYLCLCSFKPQQLMDYSRTQTQPSQAALFLCLVTVGASFTPSGWCPEICTGQLAGPWATQDTEVTIPRGVVSTASPGPCQCQSPHTHGLAMSTTHHCHRQGRAKVG